MADSEDERLPEVTGFLFWLMWHAVFPLIVLLAFYPLAKFFVKVKHPFAEAFAGTDLIIYSAVLLLAVAVRTQLHNYAQRRRLALLPHWAQMFAILSLVYLGALKYRILIGDCKITPESVREMGFLGGFHVSLTLLAVALSCYSYWKTVNGEQYVKNRIVGEQVI